MNGERLPFLLQGHACVCIQWRVGCHVLCLYTVTGVGVMPCVCIQWLVGGMSCVCILCRDGLPCPVSVYCDGVECHVLCLRHVIPVWQHISQSTTATSRHRRDMTSGVSSDVKPQTTNNNLQGHCYNVPCEHTIRYKTTVSSAREKECAHRNGHGAVWLAVIHI